LSRTTKEADAILDRGGVILTKGLEIRRSSPKRGKRAQKLSDDSPVMLIERGSTDVVNRAIERLKAEHAQRRRDAGKR
jgi:hypothetical protein